MPRAADRMPVRPGWAVPTALLALTAALTLLSGRYGYHRDELYFRMLPPAWGYVDQPPLTPAIARLTTVLGDDLWALRAPALLCAGLGVVVVVALTREVGGGRLAQGLAAWGFAFGTMTLSFGHLLLTASLDLVVWPLVLLGVLRALLRDDPRWWLLAGLVVGLSTYNKWLITLLVVGVVGGLLLVGPRRVLWSRWLLGAAALAVLIALPNIVYQVRTGLPQSQVGRALALQNGTDVRRAAVPMLVVMIGPMVFAFVVAGVVSLCRDRAWRPIRCLAPALVIVVGLTVAGGTQFYYPYGILAAVYAVGCVPAARFAERSGARRVLVLGLTGLHVVTNVVISLPVLPESVLVRTPIPTLNQSVGDQIGWPAYVAQVDTVTDQALGADPGAVVLATNYGEAGALDRFSRHPEVPRFSGHNALWSLGRPAVGTRTVVVVGDQVETLRRYFEQCSEVDRLTSGLPVANEEEGEPVSICVEPLRNWPQLWPELRHLG